MPSTIFTAPDYDPQRERRKKLIFVAVAIGILVVGTLAYLYRNWPQERTVKRFFTALQNKDYERAYAIWLHDPNWKSHPQQYAQKYPFSDFYRDWGPGGEWGLIRSFHVDGSANPKGGSGVVVAVTVNERKEQARIWVDNDKTLTFSPY